ncbi:MAG TPA: TolC family outer membrane protein [Methylibium sp.]|nr:TolC family outer membrane protein [Methylibium sp.]
MPQRPLSRRPLPRPAVLVRGLLTTGVMLLAAGGASAQSIQALYDAARGYDATFLAARAQAESAGHQYERIKALQRPTVALGAGVTRSMSDSPNADGTYATRSEVGVNARQPLFNRSNRLTIDQAERSLQAAQSDLELAEQDLIVRLTQAYFEVLAAQDTLGTAQANKTAIAEQLASAKRNFEVGTATITDTREAQARFDLAAAQEIVAENNLRTARVALDTLVGAPGVTPRPLAVPVRLPTVEPGNAEAWVVQTPTSPNVRRAQLAYDVAQLETGKARAGHLPTVDLVGSFGKSRNDSVVGRAQTVSGLEGSFTSGSVGVELNLPLFAGYSVQNRIKETLSLEEKARNDLEFTRRSVTQATRQAFLAVQSGEASVRALEAAEASSKLALEATQLGYKVGVRVNLDVLNAQTQLYTTQRDLYRARYDVVLGNLRLKQAAGSLKAEDVSSVNRLLAP